MQIGDEYELVAFIQAKWQVPLDEDVQAAALRAELENVTLADAKAAVSAINAGAERSAEFTPTSGQILRKVAELAVAPLGWDEVRRQLIKRLDEVDSLNRPGARFPWTCPEGQCDGDGIVVDEATRTAHDCSCRPAYIAARRAVGELDAMVRQWIDDRYVTWAEVRSVAEGDTTVESQMRQKWEAFSRRAVESRALVLLPGGTAPSRRLEQARAEDDRLVLGEARRAHVRRLSAGPVRASAILDAADVRFEREQVR